MNKKGVVDYLFLEIGEVVFATAIGLAVLYFVYVSTSDLSLQTKIFQEDLEQTINKIQSSSAEKIKVRYALPENIEFIKNNGKITLSDKDIILEVKYSKKANSEIKFTRNKNSLILEKNEKIA